MRPESENDVALLALRGRPRGQQATRVVRLLFPQSVIAKSGEPTVRRDWIPLQAQRLPIDFFLSGLPTRTFSSKASHIHVEARRWIILAVEKACLDLEMRQVAERGLGAALETFRHKAADLAGNIADLLNAADDPRLPVRSALVPGFGYRTARMDYLQRNDVAKATHAALDTIANARDAALKLAEFAGAGKDHLIPGHTSGDVWRQGFVSRLCFGWRDITGCDPTPDGDRFRGFVENCYASLAGATNANGLPHFRGWTGVIRTVVKDLKSRPDWSGGGRHERHLDPPGTGRGVVIETLAERRARDAAKKDAELTALPQAPGAQKTIESLVAKPRKPRPK